jgi:type II secretory ATPase GspE/PulE/Tfp pilus assembly ATPase PilB-like protein
LELRQAAIAGGMRTLRRDALDKVKAGITSLEEMDRVVV